MQRCRAKFGCIIANLRNAENHTRTLEGGLSLLTDYTAVHVLYLLPSSSMLDRWSIRGLLERNNDSADNAGARERDASPAADTMITVSVIVNVCKASDVLEALQLLSYVHVLCTL